MKPAVSLNFISFYLKSEAGSTPAAARISVRGCALTAAPGAVYDQGEGKGDPLSRPFGVPELPVVMHTCHQGSGAAVSGKVFAKEARYS